MTRRRARARPPAPPRHEWQQSLLEPSHGVCHWCGAVYTTPPERDNVGACERHEQHTRDQLRRARQAPPPPF